MIANVHFEFLAQPAAFPIGKEISIIVEVRAAAKVNVADKHAAEMADVAHAVACGADRSEKLDGAHHDHKYSHRHSDRQREDPDLAVRHHDGHCQQHAVDRAGGSNRRYQRSTATVRIDQKFYDNINDPRADSANEKISIKTPRAPSMFQISSEHREVEQVEKNVEDSAVKENISERLPDPETVNRSVWAQPEPVEPKPLARFVKQQRRNRLQEKNRNANDANCLDGSREITA